MVCFLLLANSTHLRFWVGHNEQTHIKFHAGPLSYTNSAVPSQTEPKASASYGGFPDIKFFMHWGSGSISGECHG